jgi:uncharacterized protein YprB with RNaseH-like and TPR domain
VVRQRLEMLSQARRSKPALKSSISEEELATRLQGRSLGNGVILIEQSIPFGTPHGRYILERDPTDALSILGCKADSRIESTVFMDTETTGLSGGTGTLVFLVGLGRFTLDGLKVSQFFLTGFQGEAAMLEEADKFIGEVATLVTYNGKSFDGPLLAARYRLSRMPDPFEGMEHLDLLHPTRRAFRARWPDCRLRTAEESLLGFIRAGDLPGEEAPEAWFDWVRHRATERLAALVRHNQWDVISLVALLSGLQLAYEDPIQAKANVTGIMKHRRTQLGEERVYAYLLANRAELDDEALLELARLGRRREEWGLSLEIWCDLAGKGNMEALERLAKYHEHVAKDFTVALRFARELIQKDVFGERHRHRESRLLGKMQSYKSN